MSAFAVWSPTAGEVEVDHDGRRWPMTRDDRGWWSVEIAGAGHGARYRFAVDGGDPLPDPRSPWQPEGVAGPSAVLDHNRFAWSDRQWRGAPLAAAVLYELHVGTFTEEGTFDAVIDHLDHLVDIGITAVELLPVAEFPGRWGWGYDGVLLWAPHHGYGGPDGLKRLVDAAHARGLAVILDVVYNHLGPSGNHLASFAPYFTDRYSTPWGQAVNVDGEWSDGVRDFVIANACNWLDAYHLDGLRLDAVHAIVDDSAVHLLEEMGRAVEALSAHLGRTLWLIAESDRNDPQLVRGRDAHGYGLDASWNDDFHHALHGALTGETSGYYEDYGPLALVARCYESVYAYGRDWSPFRHRHHGRSAGALPSTRFVGFLQNHDQIGNRAVGERSAALLSPGRLRIGAALVALSPMVPMLFQGEEWAASTPWLYFTDHQEVELGRAVSEGRRREFAAFGWDPEDVPDPQDPATRRRSVLRWEEVTVEPHASLLSWHRSLLALRRTWSDLTDGDRSHLSTVVDEDRGVLVVRRGAVVVAVNLGAPTEVDVDGPLQLLLASEAGVELAPEGLHLPSETVAALGPVAPAVR